MNKKKLSKNYINSENKLNKDESNLIGSIFSELKNQINKQSKIENNCEIKKLLENTKNNEFYEIYSGNNLLFYIEESDKGEFTNIPMIKELTNNKEINNIDELLLIKEDKNSENNAIKQYCYKDNVNESKVIFSVNKKIIIDDVILEEKVSKIDKKITEEVVNPKSNSINFNIVINSSINNNNCVIKNLTEITSSPKEMNNNINDQKEKEINNNFKEKIKTNIIPVKNRIKKFKRFFQNKKDNKHDKYLLELDNDGVKEFFKLINNDNNCLREEITKRKINDKHLVNYIKLYIENMINTQNHKLIHFIKHNEVYFNSILNDLYLIIKSYIIENWKWIEKVDLPYVTFNIFNKLLNQILDEDLFYDYYQKFQENNITNINTSLLEVIREKILSNSVNNLMSTNKQLETFFKNDLENEKKIIKDSFSINGSYGNYDNCLRKIINKFLGYKYILKNLEDI